MSKDTQENKNEHKTDKTAEEKVVTISEAEYNRLKQEVKDNKDQFLRTMAELDNVRKRFERDKVEFVKYANEGIINQFLNILDDLERTVKAAGEKHQDYEAFLKGVEMVMAHIYEMLKKNDVKRIDAVGKPFDPNCHEILMQQESNEHDDGKVIEEFQKGYCLGERVIRTSKVKVAVNTSNGPA